MYRKKEVKKILVISILLITIFSIGFYTIKNTFAENDNTESSDNNDACGITSIIDKYGLAFIRDNNDGKYKIRSKENLKTATFSIKKINDYTPETSIVISKDNIKYDSKNECYYFTIESNLLNTTGRNVIILQSGNVPNCNDVEVTLATEAYDAISENDQNIDLTKYQTTKVDKSDIKSSALDCNNPASDFESKICEAKNGAKNNGLKYDSETGNDSTTTFSFKCHTDQFLKDSEIYDKNGNPIFDNAGNEKYYTNKSYLYHKTSEAYQEKYQYNYDSGRTPEDTGTCSKVCEEGVIVEYGPPVASKAGLCFEYKIKVTSRVRCYSDISKIKKPKASYNLCTPAPYCNHKIGVSSTRMDQGGPNEEFDACVKKCDGGKYTSKCSTKCYKSVYGSSSTIKTSNLGFGYNTTKLSSNSVVNDSRNRAYGGYYSKRYGNIVWNNIGGWGNNSFSPSRYYQISTNWWCGITLNTNNVKNDSISCGGYTFTMKDNPIATGSGIPRQIFNSTNFYNNGSAQSYCHDDCYYSDTKCTRPFYYNYGQAEDDYQKNIKTYESLILKCKAAASCSTSTAEFSISVDYTTNKSKKTIEFPYDTNDKNKTDKLVANGSNCENNENKTVSTAKNTNTTILKYDGCYNNCANKNYYMTEWSFPGTWINSKTGELSYVDKTNTIGWRTVKNKFCIPRKVDSVNTKWYNTYYANIYSNNKEVLEKNNSCSINYDDYKNLYKDGNSNDITWNINGKTTKFGKFGWNINVSCFYAINDTCQSNGGIEARVRTVDLKNVFPDKSGSTSTSSTKRAVGFNWTSRANISSTTTDGSPSFTSYPGAYLNDIQKINYSIYNGEDYLDYQFRLSTSDLKKIKEIHKEQGNDNYTNYTGTFKKGKGGVSRYSSNLIHEYLKNNKIPQSFNAYDCNNMENYSTGCNSKKDSNE